MYEADINIDVSTLAHMQNINDEAKLQQMLLKGVSCFIHATCNFSA